MIVINSRHISSTLAASILILISTFSFADDSECKSIFCAADQDYADIYKQAKTAATKQAAAVKKSLDEASAEAFKPKTSLAGSSCLDGIYGLSADAELIDPRNIAKLNFTQILKDYVKKTACTAAVTAANKQITAVNDSINAAGKKISEETYGLISFSSQTNNSGIFKVTKKVTALQDSEFMKKISDQTNAAANKKFFGTADPFNGKNNVDLTDKRYMKDGATISTKESSSISADELEKGAECYFNKC